MYRESADVTRKIYPAVNLNFAVFPCLATRPFVNCLHQRIGASSPGSPMIGVPLICQSPDGNGGESNGGGGIRRVVGAGIAPARRRVGGSAQLLEQRFVQSFPERFVHFARDNFGFRLFFLALGFRLLLLALGSCFLQRPSGGICRGPFFFSQCFLAFV